MVAVTPGRLKNGDITLLGLGDKRLSENQGSKAHQSPEEELAEVREILRKESEKELAGAAELGKTAVSMIKIYFNSNWNFSESVICDP